MLFMWVVGITLGVIIVGCLIYGWYDLNNYSKKKRLLILSGIVVGITMLVFLIGFLANTLGTIGLFLLCTIAFIGPAFKG